jgi:hypothetical protein
LSNKNKRNKATTPMPERLSSLPKCCLVSLNFIIFAAGKYRDKIGFFPAGHRLLQKKRSQLTNIYLTHLPGN